MEVSEVKDYSFLGNDTFPNLYYALVYERKYLERQIYERFLRSRKMYRVKMYVESKRPLTKAKFISS